MLKTKVLKKHLSMNNLQWSKNKPILPGSQWFWKLTYPEEVLGRFWVKREQERKREKGLALFLFLMTAKVIMKFSFTFRVPLRKLSGLKNNRQNIYRKSNPLTTIYLTLCVSPFLLQYVIKQKATVFIFFPRFCF